MNILFALVFLLSCILLLFHSPESFLASLLDGASKSAVLCGSLVATYAVWLGLMRVWEDSGVSQKFSALIKPLAKKLFKTEDKETLNALCMKLSVNLLGISGAATPYGIRAATLLNRAPHAEYSSAMLFVLNATSIQIIPTSMVGVRVALGSAAPADIILPTLITSALSTLLGVLLTRILIPPTGEKTKKITDLRLKSRGAGI